jgi:hypothetical protein
MRMEHVLAQDHVCCRTSAVLLLSARVGMLVFLDNNFVSDTFNSL